MRRTFASATVIAGVAFAAGLGGCSAQVEPPGQAEAVAGSQAADTTEGEARSAEATARLEDAFTQQFVQGTIDRAALAPAIDEALRSLPEAERGDAQAHIDAAIDDGEKLAAQMSPEERAQAVAPDEEQLGSAGEAQFGGWGWGRRRFPSGRRFFRGFHGFGDCDFDDPFCSRRFGRGRRFW